MTLTEHPAAIVTSVPFPFQPRGSKRHNKTTTAWPWPTPPTSHIKPNAQEHFEALIDGANAHLNCIYSCGASISAVYAKRVRIKLCFTSLSSMQVHAAIDDDRPLSAPPPVDTAGYGLPAGQRNRMAPRSLGEALREAGEALDSSSNGGETPSEEDYDENVRPAYATGTQNHQERQARRRKADVVSHPSDRWKDGKARHKATVVRDASGVHIYPDDDKALQETLRRSSLRAKDPKNGNRKFKFRDHLFTHQFSAFDPHNPKSMNSPFHGFYTLFWLAVTLFVFKISAVNWRIHGTPLGSNEIMQTMFHRDGNVYIARPLQ